MTRDPGLYWVEGADDEADVARWDGTQWWLHGSEQPMGADDLTVLCPAPLVYRPEERLAEALRKAGEYDPRMVRRGGNGAPE